MNKLLLFLIPILFINCFQKNKNYYEYWESFFNTHEELKNKSFMGGEYDILFGNLHPDKEAILKKDQNGNYFLAGSVQKGKEGLNVNLNADIFPGNNDLLHVYTKYQFNKNYNRETYFIQRTSHFNSSEFSILDFISWYSAILELLPLEKIQASSTYKLFCSYFDCDLSKTDTVLSMNFTPNSKFKEDHFQQYSRLKKFLELATIEVKILSPSSIEIFSLVNNNKYYRIEIPQVKINQFTGLYQIMVTLKINYYGLKINLNDIGYAIQIEKNQNDITLKGNYNKYPKIIIDGRLWHILPPELLNIFIPGDMNSYFSNYFDMIFKNNQLKIITNINKNRANMVVFNQSEVFRKPFRIFGNPTKNEKNNSKFNHEFEKAILEDLK